MNALLPLIVCVQKEIARSVSGMFRPIADLNHCRRLSTIVMEAIGVSQIRAAKSVKRSNIDSGGVSSIWKEFKTSRRIRQSVRLRRSICHSPLRRRGDPNAVRLRIHTPKMPRVIGTSGTSPAGQSEEGGNAIDHQRAVTVGCTGSINIFANC